MKTTIIETVNHKSQDYETCGNYGTYKGINWIKISKLSSPDREFLVAVHELVEQYLCQKRHISDKEICAFDIKFEKERKLGKHTPEEEPGDDQKAPYRREHFFATNIERQIALELGVDWTKYEKECVDLEY